LTITTLSALSLGLASCNAKPAAENVAETSVETVAPAENAGTEAVADNSTTDANAATAEAAMAGANDTEALDGTSTPVGPGK
jgi:uncharacterized protein (DUF2342 family)